MPDTASDRVGKLKINAPIPARKATSMPTMINPPIKLKSFLVVSAYAESPTKIAPVPPSAVITS